MRNSKLCVVLCCVAGFGLLLGWTLPQAEASGIVQSAYNLIQNAGSSLARRTTLNCDGLSVFCADSGGKTVISSTPFSGPANQLVSFGPGNTPTDSGISAIPNIGGWNLQGLQVQAGVWSAGIVTLTLRTGSPSNRSGAGTYVEIAGMTPTAYNGIFQLTGGTLTTVSYALAVNPGAYASTPFPLVYIIPRFTLQADSPFGTIIALAANANCVPDGQDALAPPLLITGGDRNINNNSFYVGCDGHSAAIHQNGLLKDFFNGLVNSWTSEHTIGWTGSPSSNPSLSANIDTSIRRVDVGIVGFSCAQSSFVPCSFEAAFGAFLPVATSALKICTAVTGVPWRASVNDATLPALGIALTGGGSTFANVHCSLTTGTYLVDGL